MNKKNKMFSENFELSFLNSLNSINDFEIPSIPEPPKIEPYENYNKTISEIVKGEIIKVDSFNDLIYAITKNPNQIVILDQNYNILKTYSQWQRQGKTIDLPEIKIVKINPFGEFNFITYEDSNAWFASTNNIFDYSKINNLICLSTIQIESFDKLFFYDIFPDLNNKNIVSTIYENKNSFPSKYFYCNFDIKKGTSFSQEIKLPEQTTKIQGYSQSYFNNTEKIFLFKGMFSSRYESKHFELKQELDNNDNLILVIGESIQGIGFWLSENNLKNLNNELPVLYYDRYINAKNEYSINIFTKDRQTSIVRSEWGGRDNFDYQEVKFFEKDNLIFVFLYSTNSPSGENYKKIILLTNPFGNEDNEKIKNSTIELEKDLLKNDYIFFNVKENNFNKIYLDSLTTKTTKTFKTIYSNNLTYFDLPYFYNPKYSKYDFQNQRVSIYNKGKKIIGDVDIIQNVFTNNSLLYLIKLDQNSMNNLELNNFKLITNSNNEMINFIFDTTKTRFETKNINLNLIYKNIDNTNLKKSFLNEVSTDTVFAFSSNAASQEFNIIAVNFLKFTFEDNSFKIFDYTNKKIGFIKDNLFYINKTILNSSNKKIISVSAFNKNKDNLINNPFFIFEVNVNPNEVLNLSISGKLKEI